MKKLILAALAATSAIMPVAAQAQYRDHYTGQYGDRYDRHEYRGDRYRYGRDGYNYYGFDRWDRYDPRYDQRRQDYRRDDYRRCNDGTTGTVVGAIAGGLLGRTIDTRGDRTAGTVIGGVGGALAGRAIERNCR